MSDHRERGTDGGFGSQHQGTERDRCPFGGIELGSFFGGPAAFRTDQDSGGIGGGRLIDGRQGVRLALFIAPVAVGGFVFQCGGEFDRVFDFRRSESSRLLAGFVRDASPAIGALLSALEESSFAARGGNRNDACDAQFGGLFYRPFETVEFYEREVERDLGRGRAGVEFFVDAEADEIAAGIFHGGEPDAMVVCDFEGLAGIDTKHAGEMVRVFAADFRRAAVYFVNEKTPSRHVQLLRYRFSPDMIALLRGTLIEKHPNQVILDAGGVGYDVTIPVSTFTKLPDTGAREVVLRVHTHVREDIFALYGFLTVDEKVLFEKLIGVSNIGPGLAIKVLSGMAIDDLINGIRRGEVEKLVRIPGVGRKTAERMVLELRDKLAAPAGEDAAAVAAPSLAAVEEDVMSALLNLGCARPAAEAAVRKARSGGAPAEFEPLFRRSLELVR